MLIDISCMLQQFNDLQECYLQKRRNWIKHLHKGDERSTKNSSKEDYSPGLEDFQSVLNTFTRYRYSFLQ